MMEKKVCELKRGDRVASGVVAGVSEIVTPCEQFGETTVRSVVVHVVDAPLWIGAPGEVVEAA